MVFIDSGAWIARFVDRDQNHSRSVRAWKRLSRLGWRCYTSNFVLDETFTLLARRADYAFAAARARQILTSRELTVLRPHDEDELRGVDLFEKFAGQRVSFTDCVSFALMKKHGITRAFTFDRHFSSAGFETWPD